MAIPHRRLIWLGALVFVAPAAASCGLNPQPEPPGDTSGGSAGSGGTVGGGAGGGAGADGGLVLDGSTGGTGGSAGSGGGAFNGPDAGDASGDAESDQANDAGDDAADAHVDSGDGGAFACGSQTCGPTQLCVHPCCGGAAPQCTSVDDAGTCPAGFHVVASCPGSSGPGCEQDPCTPPPPTCKDVPPGCAGNATCACLPSDTCSPNSCGTVQGVDVYCICA